MLKNKLKVGDYVYSQIYMDRPAKLDLCQVVESIGDQVRVKYIHNGCIGTPSAFIWFIKLTTKEMLAEGLSVPKIVQSLDMLESDD